MPHLIQLGGSVFAIQDMLEMVKFVVVTQTPMGFLMLILIVLSHLARKIIVLIYQIPIKLNLIVTAWAMLVIIVPMTTIPDRKMKMEISLVTLVMLELTLIMMELLTVPTTVLPFLTLIN